MDCVKDVVIGIARTKGNPCDRLFKSELSFEKAIVALLVIVPVYDDTR